MKNLLFNNRKNTSGHHRGMTLVELLVVSAIMVVLMSVSIPVLTPLANNRMSRESARGVQAAVESARTRAIRLGRPCGVAFTPFHQDYPFGCITIEQLSAPPTFQSTCTVGKNGVQSVTQYNSNRSWVRGDSVQVNYTGPIFVYDGSKWSSSNSAGFGYSYNYQDFNTGQNMNCSVSLFPVNESSNAFAKALGIEASYTLPRGYIVDLAYSGVGADGKWLNSISTNGTTAKRYPPTIIFNPDGSAQLYMNGQPVYLGNLADPKVYILVGSWGKMLDKSKASIADSDEPIKNNWDNPDAYWVVINTKTGLVTTARNLGSGRTLSITDQSKARGGN